VLVHASAEHLQMRLHHGQLRRLHAPAKASQRHHVALVGAHLAVLVRVVEHRLERGGVVLLTRGGGISDVGIGSAHA